MKKKEVKKRKIMDGKEEVERREKRGKVEREKKLSARFNVSKNVPKHSPQGKGEKKRVCPCNLYKRTEKNENSKKENRRGLEKERKERKGNKGGIKSSGRK